MQAAHSEDRLLTAIIYSICLHAAIILALVIANQITWPSLQVNMDVTHVSLVNLPPPKKGKASMALPKATIQEIKSIPQEKAKPDTMAEIEKPKEKKKEEEKKAKSPDISKEIESEVTKIQQELDIEKQIAAIAAANQDVKPGEGTMNPEEMGAAEGTEEGTGIVGGYELAQYQDVVRAKVLSSWHLPPWTIDALPPDTHALIVVYIAEDGSLLRTEIEKSSKNSVFDQSALRAVRRAAPLPAPPDDLAREARNKGIVMRFSPKKKG